MTHDPILVARNWCEVAGGLGLMLPNFTVRERPERFADWCHQVEIVAEIARRDLVGGFVERERARADMLANAPHYADT